jgi:hypothetical protein
MSSSRHHQWVCLRRVERQRCVRADIDNQSGCLPEAADQLLGGANQEVVTEPAWVDVGQLS